MYVLYLDDAGSPGNASESYFVLGGVCVYEAQIDWFSRELDKLGAVYNPASPEDVEFHASEVFSRRVAPWNSLSGDEARGTLKSVLQIVNSSYSTTTRLFACAIDKRAYPGSDPVAMAFEDLCKRFDLFLNRLKADGDTQRGLIVLDRTTRETSLQKLSRECAGCRSRSVLRLPALQRRRCTVLRYRCAPLRLSRQRNSRACS